MTDLNSYKLRAEGNVPSQVPDLVAFIADRKKFKDEIWQKRQDKLVSMSNKMDKLINIYDEKNGAIPTDTKQAFMFYKSALAHQAKNTLQASPLDPDFIDFAPLGVEADPDLLQKTKDLTKAHRIWRYKGKYGKARSESKSDFTWGNSFIEMSTNYDGEKPMFTEYTYAPFREMRNFYGDTDIMRIIDYSIESYVENYDKEMLKKVSLGGILDVETAINQQAETENEYNSKKDIIQVVRYYDPSRLMFAEIHGGNGFIYKDLSDKNYPFIRENGKGFSPFKESRFYEQPSGNYFGWGIFDYIIDLANLETTITNLTAMEAVWDAGAPSFLFSNNPDDMEQKINLHLRNLNKGINKPIVQKDSGIGTQGQVQTLKKGVDNRNMETWDSTTVSRAERFSGLDVRALSDYAPTAEQQKLKKLEVDKMNLRVLEVNAEREKEFAIKEMSFIQNGKTAFHNYEIETFDSVSEEFKTEDGYMPPLMKKVGDILNGVKDVELKIQPRMEGVLADQDFMEIQTMQDDMVMLLPGTSARDIAMEKYFAKKNPDWGLKRQDFSAPTAAQPQQGQRQPQQQGEPTQALTKQLQPA